MAWLDNERVYPDLIVCWSIFNNFRRCKSFIGYRNSEKIAEVNDNIWITIDRLKITEKSFIGFDEHIWTGPNDSFHERWKPESAHCLWSEKDYRKFLESFPQYFTFCENGFIKVNVSGLCGKESIEEPISMYELQHYSLSTLTTQGTYSRALLETLGFDKKKPRGDKSK